MKKRVFVSGCFDLLHSGHVAFFEEAATLGDLYVGVGSDRTVYGLKGRKPINPEQERLYMIQSLRCVSETFINSGSGTLDFLPELDRIRPDILFVNEDGHSPEKEYLCREREIAYVIGHRQPAPGLPARSSTVLRQECRIPYRIDLAGGWLDQPFVSKHHPGAVITIPIEPDYDFNDRSGMSTSTRKKAIELWQTDIPPGDREQLARILFSYENPPGSTYISGSQDALGLILPGLNYLYYEAGMYWPSRIKSVTNPSILDWLEGTLSLLPLSPRESGFNVLDRMEISAEKADRLARAADDLWLAVMTRDIRLLGSSMTASFEAQVSMFPYMSNPFIRKVISSIEHKALGWKLSGAGGGGYLVLVTERRMPNTLNVRIRRPSI
ncbi:MAG: adenylyltransferase/cytidyltransferase family protein [Syntrophaceae bacterium]|nr:adenylyltransferase/cytidyltransferase family protein [Syntrophaceae bacterium]